MLKSFASVFVQRISQTRCGAKKYYITMNDENEMAMIREIENEHQKNADAARTNVIRCIARSV